MPREYEMANQTNAYKNHTGDKQMNFTNTDCVESIMLDYLWVGLLLNSHSNTQVHEQVNWQLSGQINPIKYKITQEINK
jgi:hypothetical protein